MGALWSKFETIWLKAAISCKTLYAVLKNYTEKSWNPLKA